MKKVTKAVAKQQSGPKLTLVKTPFTENQLLRILQRTPKSCIQERVAKGGGTWKYVSGTYIRKALNHIFGWRWDFEIMQHGESQAGKPKAHQVWVLGKLTVRVGNEEIVKTQFGRCDVKYRQGTTSQLDFGNDMKGAATDSLKKCSAELGLASDIYSSDEYKDVAIAQPVTVSKVKASVSDLNTIAKMSKKLKIKVRFNPKTLTKVRASKIIATLMEKQQKNGGKING